MTYTTEEYKNIARLLMSADNGNVLLGLEMIGQDKSIDFKKTKLIYPLMILNQFNYQDEIISRLKLIMTADFKKKYKPYMPFFGIYELIYYQDEKKKNRIQKKWGVFIKKVKPYLPFFTMNPKYIDKLGLLGYRMSNYFNLHKEGRITLELCLEHDPTNGERHFDIAYLISELVEKGECIKDIPKIIEHYKKAIEYGYDVPLSYNNLGCVYQSKLNDDAQAEIYYRKALELKPDKVRAMGNLASVTTDWTKAKAMYLEVLELDEDNALAHNNLACGLREYEAEYEKATEHALKSLEVDEDECIYTTLAEIYWYGKTKPLEEVLKTLQKALGINKKYADALALQALIYIETNQKLAIAKSNIQEVLRQKPKHKLALNLKNKWSNIS